MSNSKYLQRTVRPTLSPRRAGFSLIEVVIALGVFVFGALAIVRIFPGALGVIQNSEQRATAQRMAQTTLARYTNSPLSVPEAVIDVHPSLHSAATNETGWSDFSGAVFGSGTRNESLPRQPFGTDDISRDNTADVLTPISASAAGHFRRVVGEEHSVTREVDGAGTPRGIITLRYPFVQPETTDATAAVHQPLMFETFTLSDVTINASGLLDFTNATSATDGTSASDPTSDPRRPADNLRLATAIPTAPNRETVTFYVSYRWQIGDGDINAVAEEPKRFLPDGLYDDTTSPQVLEARLRSSTMNFGTPLGFHVLSGPVQVKVRRLVGVAPVSPTQAKITQNLGRIVLPQNEVGRRLSVDYTVPDWRMIVHDDNLSTKLSADDQEFVTSLNHTFDTGGTPGTIGDGRQTVVPTRFIADTELSTNTNLNQRPSQVYAMVQGTNTTGNLTTSAAQWSPDKYPAQDNLDREGVAAGARTPRPLGVRFKTGQTFFDTTGLARPSTRTVYRNLDGWLEQPSVAARSYMPFSDRPVFGAGEVRERLREPWREYFYDANLASGVTEPSPRKAIVLHASEAGNTFLVTYRLSSGTVLSDIPVTAESAVADRSNPILNFVPGAFFGSFREGTNTRAAASIALLYLPDTDRPNAPTSNEGAKIGLPLNEQGSLSGRTVTSILSLRGASVRVRSAWFDGSRYSQAAVTGYRSLDVESANRP